MVVAIIAKTGELTLPEAHGLDLEAAWIGDETNIEANIGKGKRHPGGPTCFFQGKEVPCFATNSENGGITSEILAQCFKRMDNVGLFPRSPDLPNPFVTLDGHGSRLQLPFLQHVSDEKRRWHAALGLPCGTSKWQLGDSPEQNGSMQTHIVLAKRDVMWKNEACASLQRLRERKSCLSQTSQILMASPMFKATSMPLLRGGGGL
jgi:hypothetical protein